MKTAIAESHKVAETVQFAGLAKRLKAFAFDYLIIVSYILVLLVIGLAITMIVGPIDQAVPLFDSPIAMDVLAFLVLILPVVLYFTLQEGSARQATWGKHKAGIRVVDASGNRLTRTQALVRSLVKLLPWQIAHTCIFHVEGWPLAPTQPSPPVLAGFALVYALVGLYAVSALISKQHRTPYDWVAGSYVTVVQ